MIAKGKLESLTHVYEDGKFKESSISIRDFPKIISFCGLVPEFLLGKEIKLEERRHKDKFYQRIDYMENGLSYQIVNDTN